MSTDKITNSQNVNTNASIYNTKDLKKSEQKTDEQKSIFDVANKNKNNNQTQDTVKGKVKDKEGKLVEQDYTKVKDLENGRKLVTGKDGKQHVMSHDGVILSDSYLKQQTAKGNDKQKQAAKTTTLSKEKNNSLNSIIKGHNAAQKAFDKQMKDDGWAGDVADGVSALWNSNNRATKVRKDLEASKNNITQLKEAAKQGDAQFNAKFKDIYGIDYNQKAMDAYQKDPTEENYQKAFGTKQKNIKSRVDNYNQSQQTGAMAVKTTAKIGAGIAVGVATGGTGFVAMGAAAVGTAAASVAIEETDRLKVGDAVSKGKIEFREGTDHGQILKDAAFDGAAVFAGGAVAKGASAIVKGAKAATAAGQTAGALTKGQKAAKAGLTMTGDVATGAAQEKLQTGQVTLEGTLMNAAMSGAGSAAETGLLKEGYQAVKKAFGKAVDKASDGVEQVKASVTGKAKAAQSEVSPKPTEQVHDANGNPVAGGLFGGNEASSGGGIFSKMKRAVGIEPEGMKSLKARNPQNYSAAKSAGLDEAVDNGNVNKRIYSDLQRDPGNVVSQRMLKALDLERQGKTLVTTLDNGVSPSAISQHVGNGEVAKINGRLYVNDGGNAVPINMSQKKFEELFPPVGTAMSYQPGGNVCPIVSQLNTMMDSSSGRAALYSRFEQRGNDVYVHLDGRENPIKFPNGKPANAPGAKLGENAAPGMEMLNQAVLVNDMKGGGKVNNIADLSAETLEREAGDLKHSFTRSSEALGMKYPKEGVVSRYGLNQESPTWKSDVEQKLNSFKPGQDTMGAIWDVHARSVVDYNPKTKTVTYHDPYNGGVDTQCSLDEFTNKAAYIYHRPTTASPQQRLQSGGTSQAQTHTRQNETTFNQPAESTSSQASQQRPRYTIGEQSTQTTNPQVARTTSEHTPTSSTQAQKARISSTNMKEIGNIKGQPVMARYVDRIGDIYTVEVNGKQYQMAPGHTVKVSDNVSLKCGQYGVTAEINQNTMPHGTTTTSTQARTSSKPLGRASIPIPAGYREVGTTIVHGKECAQIQDSSGRILTEIDGKWRLMI